MHLLTWNIRERPAMAKLAATYLAREAKGDYVIAVLQEWTTDCQQVANLDSLNSELRWVVNGTKILIYSKALDVRDSCSHDSGRAILARFRLPSGHELNCVGMHWHSMHNHSDIENDQYTRGGAMALFRHYLEEQLSDMERKLGNSAPSVIMGDFNTTTSDRDMTSPCCLFALPPGHRSTPRMEKETGRLKVPWRVVDVAHSPNLGTYFYHERWKHYDHIALTGDLARDALKSSPPWKAEVLFEMEGNEFLAPPCDDTSVRRPRGDKYASDHMPVRLIIHYQ